jgi:hypothetical protein
MFSLLLPSGSLSACHARAALLPRPPLPGRCSGWAGRAVQPRLGSAPIAREVFAERVGQHLGTDDEVVSVGDDVVPVQAERAWTVIPRSRSPVRPG